MTELNVPKMMMNETLSVDEIFREFLIGFANYLTSNKVCVEMRQELAICIRVGEL